MSDDQDITYPRNHLARLGLKALGRLLLSTLADVKISGRENLPGRGPLLVVGNHVGVMEVAMMVVYLPWQIEIVGVGDIPVDPRFAWVANSYGYIPIQRGRMDRLAMRRALSVLEQGGVVGIFPEGGIWDTRLKEAHTGVSWLSYRAGVPVLPIGFGGMVGAVSALTGFKRPRLSMNIAGLLPAVEPQPGMPLKDSLQESARKILGHVEQLIPEQDQMKAPQLLDERFELQVELFDPNDKPVQPPPELAIQHASALSLFFFRPVLLDIFRRNLQRPVEVLQHLEGRLDPQRVAAATGAILAYLKDENPYLLSYRFGYQTAGAMQVGLQELDALSRWAAEQGCRLKLTPIHRYRLPGRDDEIVETDPGAAHRM